MKSKHILIALGITAGVVLLAVKANASGDVHKQPAPPKDPNLNPELADQESNNETQVFNPNPNLSRLSYGTYCCPAGQELISGKCKSHNGQMWVTMGNPQICKKSSNRKRGQYTNPALQQVFGMLRR